MLSTRIQVDDFRYGSVVAITRPRILYVQKSPHDIHLCNSLSLAAYTAFIWVVRESYVHVVPALGRPRPRARGPGGILNIRREAKDKDRNANSRLSSRASSFPKMLELPTRTPVESSMARLIPGEEGSLPGYPALFGTMPKRSAFHGRNDLALTATAVRGRRQRNRCPVKRKAAPNDAARGEKQLGAF